MTHSETSMVTALEAQVASLLELVRDIRNKAKIKDSVWCCSACNEYWLDRDAEHQADDEHYCPACGDLMEETIPAA